MNLFSRMPLLLLVGWFSIGAIQWNASPVFASEFHYDAKAKRDPFLSPAEAALLKKQIGPGELHLEGIIIDPKSVSYAVVNREVVKAGETFSGFLLKKIESNAATFEKDGETFVLFLREDEKSAANQNAQSLTPKKE